MKPLRLLVTYTAKPGQRDAFLRAVLQSGVPETVRQEDGCLRYDYFLSAHPHGGRKDPCEGGCGERI